MLDLLHISTENSDTSCVKTFLQILETNVGTDYYSYLYLCFSGLENLIKDNRLLRNQIDSNNNYLSNYETKAEDAKRGLKEFKTLVEKAKEQFFDLAYQPNLTEYTDNLKQKLDEIISHALEANEMLKPTDNLAEDIKDIKARLKNSVADIKFAYDSLRNLKELKIFKNSTRETCQAEFEQAVDKKNATEMFNTLWELALVEARGLNEIANFARQLTIKYPSGAEEFEELDETQAEKLISNYDNYYSDLSKITDKDLK